MHVIPVITKEKNLSKDRFELTKHMPRRTGSRSLANILIGRVLQKQIKDRNFNA